MKKEYVLTAIIAVLIGGQAFVLKSAGSHPSSTGAPGEQTCAKSGCHTDGVLSSGAGVNFHTFKDASGNDVTEYSAGDMYSITVRMVVPGITKFGFEIVALDDNDENIGDWLITDAVRTWKQLNSDPSSLNRKYVTHTTTGNQPTSSGEAIWTFDWEAPVSGTGDVDFYYCTSACNGDGSVNGDDLYTSNFTVTEASGIGISQHATAESMQFVAQHQKDGNGIRIDYALTKGADIMVKLTDINGKYITSRSVTFRPDGAYSETLDIPSISSGMYLVHLVVNNQVYSKKVLIL